MVEVTADREQSITRVNILAEVEVIHLINVSHVHVSLQQGIQNIIVGTDT